MRRVIGSTKGRTSGKKTTIGIVVFDGAEELDFIGPFEVLSVARQLGAPITVDLVTHQAHSALVGAHGLRFQATRRLGSKHWDWLIVPGGGWVSRAPRGAWAEYKRGALPALLKRAFHNGTAIATVCTGALLISELLRGRRATTHHLALRDLRCTGAQIKRERIVDDGNLVSAGGVSSGLDLALHLIRRLAGTRLAALTAERMEYAIQRKPVRVRNGT